MHHPVINVLRDMVENGVMDSVHGITTEIAVCQEEEDHEGVKSKKVQFRDLVSANYCFFKVQVRFFWLQITILIIYVPTLNIL